GVVHDPHAPPPRRRAPPRAAGPAPARARDRHRTRGARAAHPIRRVRLRPHQLLVRDPVRLVGVGPVPSAQILYV
ncbi:MAG: hypothetical protein AVDCRST_MAG11-3384, partial [uncultured Gemmatimonadaceae bacterium]